MKNISLCQIKILCIFKQNESLYVTEINFAVVLRWLHNIISLYTVSKFLANRKGPFPSKTWKIQIAKMVDRNYTVSRASICRLWMYMRCPSSNSIGILLLGILSYYNQLSGFLEWTIGHLQFIGHMLLKFCGINRRIPFQGIPPAMKRNHFSGQRSSALIA